MCVIQPLTTKCIKISKHCLFVGTFTRLFQVFCEEQPVEQQGLFVYFVFQGNVHPLNLRQRSFFLTWQGSWLSFGAAQVQHMENKKDLCDA
jgi:hypothetical protein